VTFSHQEQQITFSPPPPPLGAEIWHQSEAQFPRCVENADPKLPVGRTPRPRSEPQAACTRISCFRVACPAGHG
jgi:hypothetical protein